jgi:hypothetical protein
VLAIPLLPGAGLSFVESVVISIWLLEIQALMIWKLSEVKSACRIKEVVSRKDDMVALTL